jgi:hypothetical protein
VVEQEADVIHTVKVIAGGFVLLAFCLLIGRLVGGPAPAAGVATAAKLFIPLWMVAAGINMWIGVSKAGYTFAEEAPIFLVVFAVPAAVALLIMWKLSRG